ncbi:MAG: diguanylate cyclase [Spirochaetes bacterium]|nr:diguanylate cyclase [Spirochaetota bacterium]
MKNPNFALSDTLSYDIILGLVDKDLVDKETRKKVNTFIERYGQKIFSIVIYKLTNLQFQPDEAKRIWEGIIDNLHRLNKFLRRDVGVYVAAVDFLVNIKGKFIKDPVIIDEKYLEEMIKNVLIDDITSLYNATYFNKRMKEEIASAKRYNLPVSLLILSIDDFDKITEYMGMNESHAILKLCAQTIRKSIRSSDIPVRYNMGEFFILLPKTPKINASIVADKIRSQLDKISYNGKLNISMGMATYLTDTKKDTSELVHLARLTMHRASIEKTYEDDQSVQERRKFKRIMIDKKVNMAIVVTHPGDLNETIQRLKDISKGGIGLLLNSGTLKESDHLQGIVKKDNKELKFDGQVAWIEKEDNGLYSVGVKFLQ